MFFSGALPSIGLIVILGANVSCSAIRSQSHTSPGSKLAPHLGQILKYVLLIAIIFQSLAFPVCLHALSDLLSVDNLSASRAVSRWIWIPRNKFNAALLARAYQLIGRAYPIKCYSSFNKFSLHNYPFSRSCFCYCAYRKRPACVFAHPCWFRSDLPVCSREQYVLLNIAGWIWLIAFQSCIDSQFLLLPFCFPILACYFAFLRTFNPSPIPMYQLHNQIDPEPFKWHFYWCFFLRHTFPGSICFTL